MEKEAVARGNAGASLHPSCIDERGRAQPVRLNTKMLGYRRRCASTEHRTGCGLDLGANSLDFARRRMI